MWWMGFERNSIIRLVKILKILRCPRPISILEMAKSDVVFVNARLKLFKISHIFLQSLIIVKSS
jgi:hypothetical protein